MLKVQVVAATFLVCLTALQAEVATSQTYPNRPIRVITTSVGGGGDTALRIFAPVLSLRLGQSVVIDNRASTANRGAEIVSKAAPDGYTLLVFGSTIWLAPLMQPVPYDPIKDFTPVTLLTSTFSLVVVHPSVPVKSIKELIALAKAKPGVLNYGSGNPGSASHLATELFKSMAGVDMVRIPFKGVGPAVSALVAGEVQVMFVNAAAASTSVKSGRLRALAITSDKPSVQFPELPTVTDSGLRGYEATSGSGMLAPAKTPAAVVTLLNQAVARVLHEPDVKQKFLDTGVETVGNSPKEFSEVIKSEMIRLGKVIKDLNIRLE